MPAFLATELSLGDLGTLPHLWFAGSRRPATPLHLQVAMGRDIIVADQMDLHLLWGHDGRIFVKPLPAFPLVPDVWRRYLICSRPCTCENGTVPNTQAGT